MSEYPIIFTTEMVRAILDDRKTHTRRVPVERYRKWKVGDVIWVRENIRTLVNQSNNKTWEYGEFQIEYIADRTIIRCPDEHEDWWRHNWHIRPATTISSIFMPKWAARIFLVITNIRVERVQDISCDDCIDEGLIYGGSEDEIYGKTHFQLTRGKFQTLWDSLNAKRYETIYDGEGNATKRLLNYGWDKNPWVWVIEFERG